jgi:hypothetical protein
MFYTFLWVTLQRCRELDYSVQWWDDVNRIGLSEGFWRWCVHEHSTLHLIMETKASKTL